MENFFEFITSRWNLQGFLLLIMGIFYLNSQGQSLNWSVEGNYTLDLVWGSAQGIGDLNGDGYDDLVFGSSDYNNNQGLARIHLGSATGISSSPAQSLTGSGTGDYFGHALASAGDVNGDGYGDLLVGYDMYHGSGGFNGRVAIYLGNGEGVETSEWWGQSGTGNMGLGRVVAGVGDVNGDGYDDFLASEYNNANVRLYWGDSASLGSYTTLSGSEAYYGRTLSAAGDINRDGYQDLVVGSYSQSKVYVYYGSSSGVSAPLILQESGGFGICVGAGGDVNGDGYDDILTVSQTPNGTLNLFLGGASGLSNSAAWTKSGWGSSASGYSVDIIQDVNGDGLDDVLLGDTYYSNGETQEGRTVIFLGDTSGLESSEAWSTESGDYFGRLGHEVASLGDVNGDQVGDFVSVASDYGGWGAIFAYLGQADTLYPGPGNALRLNGSDEYAVLDEGDALKVDEFSIMTWVNASGGRGQNRSIFSANEEANSEGFQLFASDGNRWTFSTGDESSWASVTGDTVLEDTWTHLAATFRNDSLRLYVNGNLSGTQSHGLNWPIDVSFLIGASSNSGAEDFWVGDLDEMSYWNKALSQSEILAHLAAKASPTDSNLLACWQFDQAFGATLRDSRAHFDATLEGSLGEVWATSSVSLGDGAVAATQTSRLSLAHPDGDSIVVTTDGMAESILLYYVDEEPNSSFAPALASVSDERYWGVKVLDGTSYTIRYYYSNGPYSGLESYISFASRNDNAISTWDKLEGVVDMAQNYLEKSGQSGTEYLVGQGATPTLPIVLRNFEARQNGNQVQLTWETLSELHNKGFHVMARHQSGEFHSLGFVPGGGGEAGIYEFSTPALALGTWYFLLVQEDFDGSRYPQQIIQVQLEKTKVRIPNPWFDGAAIQMSVGNSRSVSLNLIDELGRSFDLGSWPTASGTLEARPNLSRFPAGRYVLQIKGEVWHHHTRIELP